VAAAQQLLQLLLHQRHLCPAIAGAAVVHTSAAGPPDSPRHPTTPTPHQPT
jgi:hypothetical protein